MRIIRENRRGDNIKYTIKAPEGIIIVERPVYECREPRDYEGDSTEIFTCDFFKLDISSLNADNIEEFIENNATSVHYSHNGYGEF